MSTAPCEVVVVTSQGKQVGLVWMHLGGFVKSPAVSRYASRDQYTLLTSAEVEQAIQRGELAKVAGHYTVM